MDEGYKENYVNRFVKKLKPKPGKALLYFALTIIGFILGQPVLTLLFVGFVYVAEAILATFVRKKFKAIYTILLFTLGIVLHDHLFGFLLITGLFMMDFLFNVFLRFTLRPIYKMFPLGLELVMLNVVIISLALGPIAGMICGLLFGTAYYGVIFNFSSKYQFVNIPLYTFIGYLASALPIENIVLLGMVCSLIYSLTSSFIITVFLNGRIVKAAIFIVSNLLFNYWMFTHLSPFLLRIIS